MTKKTKTADDKTKKALALTTDNQAKARDVAKTSPDTPAVEQPVDDKVKPAEQAVISALKGMEKTAKKEEDTITNDSKVLAPLFFDVLTEHYATGTNVRYEATAMRKRLFEITGYSSSTITTPLYMRIQRAIYAAWIAYEAFNGSVCGDNDNGCQLVNGQVFAADFVVRPKRADHSIDADGKDQMKMVENNATNFPKSYNTLVPVSVRDIESLYRKANPGTKKGTKKISEKDAKTLSGASKLITDTLNSGNKVGKEPYAEIETMVRVFLDNNFGDKDGNIDLAAVNDWYHEDDGDASEQPEPVKTASA